MNHLTADHKMSVEVFSSLKATKCFFKSQTFPIPFDYSLREYFFQQKTSSFYFYRTFSAFSVRHRLNMVCKYAMEKSFSFDWARQVIEQMVVQGQINLKCFLMSTLGGKEMCSAFPHFHELSWKCEHSTE